MSKALPSGLVTLYASGAPTIAYALRITRGDGAVFGFSSCDRAAVISGVTYGAGMGLSVTSIVTTAGLGVDNFELSTTDDGTFFTREQITGGLWQNARFLCFRYDWANPPATLSGVEYLAAGTFGAVKMQNGKVVAELRGLQQFLQQPVGAVSSKTCRARLGDGSCGVDIATYTHTPATVTSVASRTVFTASGLAQAADYFGEGEVRWLTGNNAGLKQKVKAHATGGVFTLALSTEAAIQVGDTFTAIAGCRHRLIEDCKTKFNNVLNFQGEPHRPGIDAITASPEVSA